MKEFKYTLNDEGIVQCCGYGNFEHSITGDEPFSLFDIIYYKKDLTTGEWIDLRTLYKYCIIPCELLPTLLDLINSVEDVLDTHIDLTTKQDNIITRVGSSVTINTYSVKVFICKLLKWDEGDKQQIADIIATWNIANENKLINIPYTFENDYELNAFIEANK